MMRWLAFVSLAVLMLGPLAACGKRGPPDVPPGEQNTYPRTYPVDRG